MLYQENHNIVSFIKFYEIRVFWSFTELLLEKVYWESQGRRKLREGDKTVVKQMI